MRAGRRFLWASLAVLLAMLGAACGGSGKEGGSGSGSVPADSLEKPSFPAGSTMANLQQKGKIVVGTKFDQAGFGLRNPTTNKIEGFDVEIAKLVAQGIFGGTLADAESKIEFVESVSRNREPFIQDGRVDMVVATYTINDARKQVVDFAGPYFVDGQAVMVAKDDDTIKGVEDLNGKKVCTVKGSTSATNLAAKAPQAELTLFDTYTLCAEALRDDRVVAVSTDRSILLGLVNTSPQDFQIAGPTFSSEPYGIGLKKGDAAFRSFLNDRLEQIFGNDDWAAAFERTLGKFGLATPEPPKVDRYT
jgi:glutamate transport system substrate-binding protein